MGLYILSIIGKKDFLVNCYLSLPFLENLKFILSTQILSSEIDCLNADFATIPKLYLQEFDRKFLFESRKESAQHIFQKVKNMQGSSSSSNFDFERTSAGSFGQSVFDDHPIF